MDAAILEKKQERLQAAREKAQKKKCSPTRKESPSETASEQHLRKRQQEQAEADISRHTQERIKENQCAKDDWQHELFLKAKVKNK